MTTLSSWTVVLGGTRISPTGTGTPTDTGVGSHDRVDRLFRSVSLLVFAEDGDELSGAVEVARRDEPDFVVELAVVCL